ncbi:MAG: hypothetical protein QNJ74_16780 [Trichodesmium sp. MO_231.B1]|nr:hypothetical protein [Trichodesmium sp. MO_231.B1]
MTVISNPVEYLLYSWGRWGDGEDGEMGRWGDGEMGRYQTHP